MAKFNSSIPDWHICDKVLIESANSLLKTFKVDHSFDIPYVAGYNKKGTVIYIDKDVYKALMEENHKEWLIPLTYHEAIEKTLSMRSEKAEFEYQYTHQVAFRMEEQLVSSLKINKNKYNSFFDKYIKKIGDLKEYPNVPKDLDLLPYKDEKDYRTLEKMLESVQFNIINKI